MARADTSGLTPFQQTVGLSDFGLTSDETLLANKFTEFGTYTVGAQQVATFGQTTQRSGGSEGEPVYMRLVDDIGNDIEGVVRFKITNAQGNRSKTLFEQRTERLSASENDREQAPLLQEYMLKAGEDSKLVLEIKVDDSSNVTLDFDASNTKALIPLTVYQ